MRKTIFFGLLLWGVLLIYVNQNPNKYDPPDSRYFMDDTTTLIAPEPKLDSAKLFKPKDTTPYKGNWMDEQ